MLKSNEKFFVKEENMRKLKNEKGITLIALVITVAVLSMISIPIVVNMTGMREFDKYAGFKEDIDILREAISIAFYDKDIGTIGPKYEGNKDFFEWNTKWRESKKCKR